MLWITVGSRWALSAEIPGALNWKQKKFNVLISVKNPNLSGIGHGGPKRPVFEHLRYGLDRVYKKHNFCSNIEWSRSRGRLAQRESVRLVIQRSEFDSRQRIGEYFFLAVAKKICWTPIYSKNPSLQRNNTINAIYWTKSGLQLNLCVKGNAPKNWSYDVKS